MKKRIAKGFLYAILALSAVFLAFTKGMTAADWEKLDWFQLTVFAVSLNVAWVNAIIAFLDNPPESKET